MIWGNHMRPQSSKEIADYSERTKRLRPNTTGYVMLTNQGLILIQIIIISQHNSIRISGLYARDPGPADKVHIKEAASRVAPSLHCSHKIEFKLWVAIERCQEPQLGAT